MRFSSTFQNSCKANKWQKRLSDSVFICHCAVTNYHRLCGFREQKCLQFYRSEVQNRSHLPKIKVSAGPHSFLETLEENLFSCLFHLLGAAHTPWPMGPSSSKTINGWSSLSHTTWLWYYPPSRLSSLKILMIISGNIPTFRSSDYLHSICNLSSPLLSNLTYSQVAGIRMWTCLWALILATQTTKPLLFSLCNSPHHSSKILCGSQWSL